MKRQYLITVEVMMVAVDDEAKSKMPSSFFRKLSITVVSRRSFKLIIPFFPHFTLIRDAIHASEGVFPKTTI